MIGIDKRSSNPLKTTNSSNPIKKVLSKKDSSRTFFTKIKLPQRSLLSLNNRSTNTQNKPYAESLNSTINKTDIDSIDKDFSKKTSIYSNDQFDSSSQIDSLTKEFPPRTQLTNLLSLDFIQSSPHFIFPNVRLISSGYFFQGVHQIEKNSMYMYSHKSIPNKMIPLVFLGSEYFLRKQIDFERVKFPLSTNEILEPLIDLFLIRPQFIREIPELHDLSGYLTLPKSILAFLFFDSSFNQSARHLCLELRTKESYNKFTVKDLCFMSQRENNIIQMNALNDRRYCEFKNQLTDIYYYKSSSSSETKQLKLSILDTMKKKTSPTSRSSPLKYSRMKKTTRQM